MHPDIKGGSFSLILEVRSKVLKRLTLFRMGVKSRSPASFFSVTFTDIGISSEIFLTFSLNSFVTLV